MSCAEIEPRLSAYLDGELAWAARTRTRRHLSTCRRCRGELQLLVVLDLQVTATAHTGPPPPYLTEAVIRRLPAMPPAPRRRPEVGRCAAGGLLLLLQGLALWAAFRWGVARGTAVSPNPQQYSPHTMPAAFRSEDRRATRLAEPAWR